MKNLKCYYFLLLIWIGCVSAGFADNANLNRFNKIAKEASQNAFSYTRKAKSQIAELQAMAAADPENLHFYIQALYHDAEVNYLQLINDSTLLKQCLIAVRTLTADRHSFENALLNYTIALCYSVDGNYANAFSMALKASEQFQRLQNETYLCKVNYLLGNICLGTQSRNMAMEYYQKAIEAGTGEEREYGLSFIALYSNMAYSEGKREMALDSLMHFIDHPRQCFDPGLLATAYFNLGSIFYTGGDEEKGAEYYTACQQCMEQHSIDNHSLTFGLTYNLGNLHMKGQHYPEALAYSYAAKEMALNSKNLVKLSYILSQIADIYKQMNDIDSAYYYLSAYNDVRNKLVNTSRTVESYQAYMSIYLESLRKELTIADQERRQFLSIIISVTIVLTLALTLLSVLHQKRRNTDRQIDQDKQIRKLQAANIESQKRELSAHALLLSGKNTILRQIDNHIKALPTDNHDVKAIRQIVKNNLTADQAWENFMIHFNKVHPGFFEKLKTCAPSLTENNLRLCAYLRISMATKQIAQVLSMSPDNVRKSSYRLKKKLGLGEEDNLYDFLRRI
jgi:DNA-binding CsgD family transcriptional regulator